MKDLFFKTLMVKGEAGGTIDRIEKTGTSGLVDTYTIYLNDGTTATFEVENGNGITSIEKTGTSGLVDTYTIYFENGETETFDVTNGEDAPSYEVPAGSVLYFDSSDPVPEGYENAANPDAETLTALQTAVSGKQNQLYATGTLEDGTDFDDLLESKVYRLDATYTYTNSPASTFGFLEVLEVGSGERMQRVTSALQSGNVYIYCRRGYGSHSSPTWLPWCVFTGSVLGS